MPDYINISGSYNMRQSNATLVHMNVSQNGNQLSGSARFRDTDSLNLWGQVAGETVDFHIEWNDGHKGHYWGRLHEPLSNRDWEGVLRGDSREECHNHQTATWEVEDIAFRALHP
ncbi:hypothetical protein [Streptomyces europaeiscabiei]|uniref:hypothetical protein n=1 Tax=Streptomyces europaeiscabiei TaxID=146819 RepID=UPI002E2E0F1F|nr:hypothetical protein [Streptomyces europaeiscabiei]